MDIKNEYVTKKTLDSTIKTLEEWLIGVLLKHKFPKGECHGEEPLRGP